MRNESFKIGEWYHCYNHSIDGRIAYEDPQDYIRFLELLYLANDESPLRREDRGVRPFEEILALPRDKPLVTIAAFCLMPSRFDLVVKEVVEGGITTFMRKLGTAYTLYFNSRHTRRGNLFLKPFRSRHMPVTHSLQQLISYVHASPAVLYEPQWKASVPTRAHARQTLPSYLRIYFLRHIPARYRRCCKKHGVILLNPAFLRVYPLHRYLGCGIIQEDQARQLPCSNTGRKVRTRIAVRR